MITGDHRITAAATAQELGIEGEVIDGSELDELSPEELARRIDNIGVFARVAPEHKVRIVRAFKARGEVVAMTGDGVNDAPALKNCRYWCGDGHHRDRCGKRSRHDGAYR